ncbi:MAG: ferritin-like domain-containing protein [Candidatus Omnitrophica bacterium]|nr:ferritin-like domain-containing protein [Candidatus Omnitrophota bacterium]
MSSSAGIKKELAKMLNQALELEHQARIQYLAHAELLKGINAEPVIERLKEIASDEQKHEGIFRNLVASYLDEEPSMGIAPTHKAKDTKKILEVNLAGEKEAIDFYKKIYQKVIENRTALQYEFETLEHEIRHVIIDEQEHVTELNVLLGI